MLRIERLASQIHAALAVGALLAAGWLVVHSLSSGQSTPAGPPAAEASDTSAPAASAGSVLHKTVFTTPRSDPLAKTPARQRSAAPKPQQIERKLPRVTFAARPQKTPHEGRRLIDLAVENGILVLNSFGTSSMPLDDLACAEMAEEVVWDHSLPNEAVEILANNDLMHQVRICAANGHVLVTCYQNTATISVRRPAPRDGCLG